MLENTSSMTASGATTTTESANTTKVSSIISGNDISSTEKQQELIEDASINNKEKNEPVIHIPKPESLDQLDQLIYRYKSIFDKTINDKKNDSGITDINNINNVIDAKNSKIEIDAIEKTLLEISNDQTKYINDLDKLRLNSKENQSTIEDELLSKQLLALQLLEKNMDIPDDLFKTIDNEKYESNTLIPDDSIDAEILPKISVSIDFDENSKNFRLFSKFSNDNNSLLGKTYNEEIVSKQIAQRIYDLERLPANLGTYSLDDSLEFITKDDLPSGIDKLKMRALVELKSLKLLTKQKSLRQKLINAVTNQAHHRIPALRDSPFTMAAQRSVQIRPKVIVPQTARIAEELERQQLLEKRKKERNVHMKKINFITEFVNDKLENSWTRRDRASQFGKTCLSAHSQIEKDEQKRIERTAKQRLAALKSNDEEAYLKLLDQTKDTRITQLLRQTNSFLDSLSEAVRVQQNEAKLLRGEEITPLTDEDREKIDYYEVAHRVKEKITKQPSILVGGTLKEYQLRGLEWMVSLYNNHLNGILADEMGLGKTIQSLSLITYLYEVKQDPGPFLVIVPLSTITNWTLEFEKWAPSLTTIIYKGSPNQRRTMQHQIKIGNFDVLLTTYEYIIKDRSLLCKHEWAHMIIDEGHRMKNAQSKLSYTIQHYYKTRNRLILTGTPLQNNLPELWALLNFVLPKIFNSAKTFEDWFNTPFANTGTQEKLELTEEETLLVIRRLHKVLRPFLLRRLKKEVEKDLPDKVEKVIKCRLSGLQHQLYQQLLKHNALFIGEGTEGATKSGLKGLNNKIMQLRKVCNHPFVFDEVEGVINPSRGNSDLLYRVSGKFELLDRVLPKFKATGHRVLMFFQMTQVMDIMEDFLRMIGLKYMRLDGSTKAEDRNEMLKAFNKPDSEYFCFLLSTRAGGLGLNLQTADTVIIFDTDWNPHQDLQAQDRAHRIGQKNEVRILRLITTDSVEEVILERAMQKLDIDGKVIQAGKFDNKSTAEEQEAFLRRLIESESAKDDDDDAEMNDEELNQTLARSDEEKLLFDKMDKERVAKEKADAKAVGLKKPAPRLIQIDELPKVFTEDITEHLKPEPVAVGRIRNTKRVYYDDGLTEEQFLEAVENEDVTLDEAIKKKRAAREKRQQQRASRLKQKENEEDENSETQNEGEIKTLENTPDTSIDNIPRDIESEKENEKVETIASRRRSGRSRSKRGRESTELPEAIVEKTSSEIESEDNKVTTDDTNGPELKKPRLRVKLSSKKVEILDDIHGIENNKESSTPDDILDNKPKPKSRSRSKKVQLVDSANDVVANDSKPVVAKSAAKRKVIIKKSDDKEMLLPSVEKLFEEMRELEDDTDGHKRTDVFEKLPSRRDYPDYYKLIQKPTCLDNIIKNCKRGALSTLKDVKEELETMYKNARFYNEEGSWVYTDADKLNEFTDEWFKDKI